MVSANVYGIPISYTTLKYLTIWVKIGKHKSSTNVLYISFAFSGQFAIMKQKIGHCTIRRIRHKSWFKLVLISKYHGHYDRLLWAWPEIWTCSKWDEVTFNDEGRAQMTSSRESLRLLLSFLKYFADRNFFTESKSRHEGW